MSFLIIDSDQKFADNLAAQLTQEFEGDVHIKEGASEAIGLIELLDDFNFVIGIKSQKDAKLGNKVLKFLKNAELNCKPEVILLGGVPDLDSGISVLMLPLTTKVKELVQVIKSHKSFQNNLAQVKANAGKKYSSIPMRLFYYVSSAPDDIFLKMTKEGKPHMVKRFNSGDAMEEADLESLKGKGVKFLYVEKEKLKRFFELFDQRFSALAESGPDQFISESDLENYAFHSLNKMGISKSSLEVAQHASHEAAKKLENDRKFQSAIKELLKGKKLGTKQLNAKMVALIAHFIIKGSDLDSAQVRENLTIAGILQDTKITDDFVTVRSDHELQALLLSDDDNINIDKHASIAADHLQKFDSISDEVIKIVRNHHGTRNGVGFGRDLGAIQSMQSLVFILAEEVSFSIIKRERSSINLNEILEAISHKYNNNSKLDKLIEHFKSNLKSH